MLSVMMTLLVGGSVHTYIHSTHSCEHSSDSCGGEEHNHHDCKICSFELSFFDRVDNVVITFVVCLLSTLLVGYIPPNININIVARTSRAPPYSII